MVEKTEVMVSVKEAVILWTYEVWKEGENVLSPVTHRGRSLLSLMPF